MRMRMHMEHEDPHVHLYVSYNDNAAAKVVKIFIVIRKLERKQKAEELQDDTNILWFLRWDVLTLFSLARTMDDAKPRRRGRRPGTYVDEDDGDR
jgi:hypothetical protein